MVAARPLTPPGTLFSKVFRKPLSKRYFEKTVPKGTVGYAHRRTCVRGCALDMRTDVRARMSHGYRTEIREEIRMSYGRISHGPVNYESTNF